MGHTPRGCEDRQVQYDYSGQKLIGYREEPFILANDVMQVFYVKDPDPANKEERHVVLQGKRRIVGVENVVDDTINLTLERTST